MTGARWDGSEPGERGPQLCIRAPLCRCRNGFAGARESRSESMDARRARTGNSPMHAGRRVACRQRRPLLQRANRFDAKFGANPAGIASAAGTAGNLLPPSRRTRQRGYPVACSFPVYNGCPRGRVCSDRLQFTFCLPPASSFGHSAVNATLTATRFPLRNPSCSCLCVFWATDGRGRNVCGLHIRCIASCVCSWPSGQVRRGGERRHHSSFPVGTNL